MICRSEIKLDSHIFFPLRPDRFSELNRDEAKRQLFDTLREKLKIDHTLTLLNIQKLSGIVLNAKYPVFVF